MRINRWACLTVACVASLAACDRGSKKIDFCYAADASGVLRDSIRLGAGYVCVARLLPMSDSVRPDSMTRSLRWYIKLDSLRTRDLVRRMR